MEGHHGLDGQRMRGFSLIELMMALMIAVVLASLAVPVLDRNRMASLQESAMTDFRSAVLLAQSEAIKQAATMVGCPIDANTVDCAQSPSWENGWLVFKDGDGDARYSSGGADELLRVSRTGDNPFYPKYPATHFSFNGQGYFSATSSVIVVCAARRALDPLAYSIMRYGEFMALPDSDGNGNPNDLNGVDLTCS